MSLSAAPRKGLARVAIAIGCALLLTLLFAAIWRLQLAHQVNRRLAVIRAAGLPTCGAELDRWYAAVPTNENAALVLKRAFALMRTFPDQRSNDVSRFGTPAHRQRLTSDQVRLLSDYAVMNAAALAKAKEALALPRVRFPVDYTLGISAPLRHLSPLKKTVQLLRDEAFLAFDANQSSDACQSIEAMLRCARALETEPDLIGQLVRIAAEAIATSTLEYGLNAGPLAAEDLSRLSAVFAASERTNLLAHALVGERAMDIQAFYTVSGEAKRRGEKDDEAEAPRIVPGPPDGRKSPWRGGLFFQRDLNFFLEGMEQNIQIANQLPSQRIEAARALETQRGDPAWRLYVLSGMLLPSLSPVVGKDAEGLALVRMAMAALAIEWFRLVEGRFPGSLDELVPHYLATVPADPCDGRPLRFQPLPHGYMLYSVGRDRHDDGGLKKPAGIPASKSPPYDLPFIVERPTAR